jgi:phosphatidylglycerol:prolipoprotein diacylglycerol transferase
MPIPPDRVNFYSLLMIAGILLTAWLWGRLHQGGSSRDGRLTIIYFAALFGALIGAKLAFLAAEGWHYRTNWLALLSGRSITGGLLGGYVAVETAKKILKYPRATGDFFAILAPMAIALGRAGCIAEGCCPGVVCEAHWWTIADATGQPRWPAACVELIFNVAFLGWSLVAWRRNWQPGNRFHIYLIAYGLFRFIHEFARDNTTLIGPLSGYHFMALALVGLGAWRYLQRRAAQPGATASLPQWAQP